MDELNRLNKSRAMGYEVIITLLNTLPSEEFFRELKGGRFDDFFLSYGNLGEESLKRGCGLILKYLKDLQIQKSTIEDLAVDRTALIRVPVKGELKPPYENLYIHKKEKEGLLSRLSNAYRESGFIPVDTKDTADFLLVELDFLRRLVLEGKLNLQKKFMEEHLGRWVRNYLELAEKKAETEFYRGVLLFTQGLINIEEGFLKSVEI